MLVVNLYGQPGAGKSTGAAYIFSKLKMAGVNAELCTEFAKDKVWEENNRLLDDQIYVFGKQNHKLFRLKDKVECAVIDSPLLISLQYGAHELPSFHQLVKDTFNTYDNISFFIKPNKPYNPSGRLQTEEESNAIGENIEKILHDCSCPYFTFSGDQRNYDTIVEIVLAELNKRRAASKL